MMSCLLSGDSLPGCGPRVRLPIRCMVCRTASARSTAALPDR